MKGADVHSSKVEKLAGFWTLTDFIRQTDLVGNVDSCDCPFGVQLRVSFNGAGRSLKLTLLDMNPSDLYLEAPSNCKLLQLAVIATTIANLIHPITIVPATQVLDIELANPLNGLVTKAIAEATHLPDYYGSAVINEVIAYPAFIKIAYDSTASAIPTLPYVCWTTAGLPSTTKFADVVGGATKSVAAIYSDSQWTYVRRSSGQRFLPPEVWCHRLFGSYGVFFADVDGDYRADALEVKTNGIYVSRSDGRSFLSSQIMTTRPFFGHVKTLFGDANGDGRSDAIAVNRGNIFVSLSDGAKFLAPTKWCDVTNSGVLATFVGDVDRDGKIDVVIIKNNGAFVLRSTGSQFGASATPETWSAGPFLATETFLLQDVDGDGRSDLIVYNSNGKPSNTRVFQSTGTAFAPAKYLPNVTMNFSVADVNGDGSPDLIELRGTGTRVYLGPLTFLPVKK